MYYELLYYFITKHPIYSITLYFFIIFLKLYNYFLTIFKDTLLTSYWHKFIINFVDVINILLIMIIVIYTGYILSLFIFENAVIFFYQVFIIVMVCSHDKPELRLYKRIVRIIKVIYVCTPYFCLTVITLYIGCLTFSNYLLYVIYVGLTQYILSDWFFDLFDPISQELNKKQEEKDEKDNTKWF